MSSEDLHAPRERLSRESILLHQAIASLREELDAVDWYRQRADDVEEEELKALLLHNMREEMEHAAMLLEWIRRFDRDFEAHLRRYLFTPGAILQEEAESEARTTGAAASEPTGGGFTIGPLKESRGDGHA